MMHGVVQDVSTSADSNDVLLNASTASAFAVYTHINIYPDHISCLLYLQRP